MLTEHIYWSCYYLVEFPEMEVVIVCDMSSAPSKVLDEYFTIESVALVVDFHTDVGDKSFTFSISTGTSFLK